MGQLAAAAIPTAVTIIGHDDEDLVNIIKVQDEAEANSEDGEGLLLGQDRLRETLYIDQGQDQQQTFENQDATTDRSPPLNEQSSMKREIQFIHGNLQEAHSYHMHHMLNTGESYAK